MGLERFSAFIPYDAFEIETPYTPEEVVEKIQGLVEEQPVFDLKDSLKRAFDFQPRSSLPFLGSATLQGFHLYPSARTRNSFRPQFYGTITPTPYGTIVKGKIHLHPLVLLFLMAWSGLFLTILLSVALALASNQQMFGVLCLSGGLPLVFYVIVMLVFYNEAQPAKQALRRALEVPEEKAV